MCALEKAEQVAAVRTRDIHEGWRDVGSRIPSPFDLMTCPCADGDSISERVGRAGLKPWISGCRNNYCDVKI